MSSDFCQSEAGQPRALPFDEWPDPKYWSNAELAEFLLHPEIYPRMRTFFEGERQKYDEMLKATLEEQEHAYLYNTLRLNTANEIRNLCQVYRMQRTAEDETVR